MHDHDHSHGIRGASNKKLLAISLTLTVTVMLVQVVGAILSGSLALLADAAHMFTDASGLVVALIASVVAARPANARRTFGYQRAEVVGALINGVILTALALWVGYEGISRLIAPSGDEVNGPLMLVVAIIGLIANAIAMWLLSSAQRKSINVRGAYLEVMGDLIGSVGVIAAAIVIVLTGWLPADAIASLFIAAMILPRAFILLKEVVSVLFESAPKGIDVEKMREHILAYDEVEDVHDLHVWQLTRGAPVFTAHIVVSDAVFTEGRADDVLTSLQACLAGHFDVEHSTFQLEPACHQHPNDVHA